MLAAIRCIHLASGKGGGPECRSCRMNALSAMSEGIEPFAYRTGLAIDRPVDSERATTEMRFSSLMRAAQDGDRAAYSALLHGILPLLQRLVRGRLGFLQAADREDL